MVEDFIDKTSFLLVVSAVLLPLIFLSKSTLNSGLVLSIFLIIQGILLFSLYSREELGFEHWYAFFAVIAGLALMLAIVILGKTLMLEFAAFFLMIGYFICVILLIFKNRIPGLKKKEKEILAKQSLLTPEELSVFRDKDELDKLVDSFSSSTNRKPRDELFEFDIEPPKQPADYDIEDSEKDTSFSATYDPEEDARELFKELREEREKREALIKKEEIEEDAEEAAEEEEGENKEDEEEKEEPFEEKESFEPRQSKKEDLSTDITPEIKFKKIGDDLYELDADLRGLKDKIREIGERAIAKKKKDEIIFENTVYAAANGTKYHYDKHCVSLKKVNKKNIVSYTTPNDARKKGLKACGMCKRK